jgi:flavin reductase (DIM6/NTAB) family NADH-FMN oxidoreductase RutF
MDARELRRVFGLFTTGVTVVTAVGPGPEPVGVTANSVTSVSLDPPLILWCLANKSTSLGAFGPGAPFAIHILAAHQADIALHFARSGRSKFEVDDWWRSHPSPPDVDGALARIECRVDALHGGGDHTIIVGAVTGLQARAAAPLVFHASRFGRFERDCGAGEADAVSQARDVWE